MLDKTVTNALLHLRAQMIRDSLDGLEHVEALLVMRGVDLSAHAVPRKIAQRRDTSILAMDALRSGPKTGKEVSLYAASVTDMTYEEARGRMYQALHNLRRKGWVERNGALWGTSQFPI
ncbi:hypothetical protein ROS217_08770 [Roseovarius sp. 217]|nr:hypothetical protein ROS217_08770 [Roseovarius sp. 217]